MREKLAALVFLLLAAIVGGYAQTPAPPLSAAGVPARAGTAASGQRLAAAESPAPTSDGRPERHWLGMPVKWVVAGVVVVATVVTLAVVAHNRTHWPPCHYAHPDPCQ